MAITKAKKGEIVKKLKESLADVESAVFVNFHSLSIGDTTALRRKLRQEGVGYTVAKKTLMRRVLDDMKVSGTTPELLGEVAIAYGKDKITPAREIYEFQKTHKEQIGILGGIFDGMYKNKEEMTVIASIPSVQVLRGMFVNVINSPIQGLVVALNAIAENRA